MKVGDLVRGEYFKGEKPVTWFDSTAVMVQITPAYEQAYFRRQVSYDHQPWLDSLGTRWEARPPEGWTGEWSPRAEFDKPKPVLVGTVPGSLTSTLLRRMEEIDLESPDLPTTERQS